MTVHHPSMTPDHTWALYVTAFAEVWAAAFATSNEWDVLRSACRKTARKLSIYPADLDLVLRVPPGIHLVRDALRGMKKKP